MKSTVDDIIIHRMNRLILNKIFYLIITVIRQYIIFAKENVRIIVEMRLRLLIIIKKYIYLNIICIYDRLRFL